MVTNGLSLVIPVYNEAGALGGLGERLAALRSGVDGPLEIILINDGSTDGSAEMLRGLAGGDIRVVEHSANRGYGASLKTGIRAAQHPWVAITDADNTYPDERIGELHARAAGEDLDMLVGARVGPGVHIPLIRRPPKWVLTRLARFLSGVDIPDLNSGLRIMRKSAVERFLRILPDGFSFTTTITLAMLSSGLRVEFTPIVYHPRVGASKIRPFYDTINFLQLVIRTSLWFNPLRVFIPLALFLFALAFLVLFLSWAFLEKAMDITFAVIFLTGVIFLAIAMLADLVDKRLD